jgi:hypothetical protein
MGKVDRHQQRFLSTWFGVFSYYHFMDILDKKKILVFRVYKGIYYVFLGENWLKNSLLVQKSPSWFFSHI